MPKKNKRSRNRLEIIKPPKLIFTILMLGELATSVLLIVSLIKMQILPAYIIIAASVVLLTILTFCSYKLVFTKKSPRTITKVLATILSIVTISLSLFAMRYSGSFNNFFSRITTKTTESKWYSVVVPVVSEVDEASDLAGKSVGFLRTDSRATMASEELKKNAGDIMIDYYDDTNILLSTLDKNLSTASVMEAERFDALTEAVETTTDKYKVAFNYKITYDKEQAETTPVEVTKEPFIVYISGSDSRIGIDDATARSDVNILAVVNPAKGKILLATIPRDTYVQLHGTTGLKDKLTHAGLYGVNMSKATIEDFLGIKIDRTLKVSFQTVIKVVDQLDGIEIFSDTEMTLNADPKAGTTKKCYYPYGPQIVDGECALRFARERKKYYRGDKHRGENQQEVLSGIIKKLSESKEYLLELPEILDIAADSFETSFTKDEITEFIRFQLSEGTNWQIESVGVDGEGTMLPTYTYNEFWPKLYVMIADEKSVEVATAKINEYLEN